MADPASNPRLRKAISEAKKAGVQKNSIETAIKKGSGELQGENYEEMRYEGYGPGGIALIVETLTDNKNRTAATVRAAFTKSGGNLGETGSVSFMFDRVGMIEYNTEVAEADDIFEAACEAGAQDVDSDKYTHEIICDPNDFNNVSDALVEKYGEPESSRLSWKAKDANELDTEKAEKIMRLIDTLEDDDDVQNVTGNFILPEIDE